MVNKLIDVFYNKLIKYCRLLNYYSVRYSFRFIKDNSKGDLVGVEIGVLFGNNAKLILDNIPIKKLYLIDPYEHSNDAWKYYYTGSKRKKKAYNKLKKYSSKIKWIYDFSYNVADSIPDNLDFVYIDGDHSYESVKREIEMYYPKLKKGGFLCGHDFDQYGVARAVVEFALKNNLKVTVGGFPIDWVTIKK